MVNVRLTLVLISYCSATSAANKAKVNSSVYEGVLLTVYIDDALTIQYMNNVDHCSCRIAMKSLAGL